MPSPPGTPQIDPAQNQFFERLNLDCHVLWYQQRFNKQIFWHNLGMPSPPGTPQIDPAQNQFFERLNLDCQCFMISAEI